MTNPYDEMRKLNEEILHLNNQFHNHDIEEVTNEEFDKKQARFDELMELYPDIGRTFVLQSLPVPLEAIEHKGLELVVFDKPMLSLQKKLTQQAFYDWVNGPAHGLEVFLEAKLDGLALRLIYMNRKLAHIFTRGDGTLGEDVSHAYRLFDNIPLSLPESFPDDFTVDGEGVVSFDAFAVYNNVVETPMANPRNAASGWVRRLEKNQDPSSFGLMTFFAYGCDELPGITSYLGIRGLLSDAGFLTPPKMTLEDLKNDVRAHGLPSDGIVAKVINLAKQKELGVNNKHPLYAVAYKYPDKEYETAYVDTVWKTGKTGRVNPIVIYEPVNIGGVTCSRASVDNYHQFMALGLREDTVLSVTRNGEVIPRIRRVVDPGVGERVKYPTECPSCGGSLRIDIGGNSSSLRCGNVSGCPSQLLNRCLALVSRKCLDIDGLGPVLLSGLIDYLIIKKPADIFFLKPDQLRADIYARVKAIHDIPLHKLIHALGLPGVEGIRAKKIAKALEAAQVDYSSGYEVMDWMNVDGNLKKIHGFGKKLSDPIIKAINDKEFQHNVLALFTKLAPFCEEETFEQKACVTGTVMMDRDDLVDVLAANGIELVDKLTKDCNVLICGEKPGKEKLSKATGLGIPMVHVTTDSSVDQLISEIKNRK